MNTPILYTAIVVNILASSISQIRADEADWEQKYAQLLKDRPAIREKVESGDATKAQVIAWMKNGGDRQKTDDKYYGRKVVLKDPNEFNKLQSDTIYSGPQPGEKLPPFEATIFRGPRKGEKYDPVAAAQRKPLVLIFQDDSVVGQKGLLLCGPAFARIAEKSSTGLVVSTTFLVDDPTPDLVFEYDFVDKIHDVIEMSVSRDRRDGPGLYGLNRNVGMTIIVAKDNRVLHNFAMPEPMLYPDPHVMGAIAEAIGEKRETVEGWFSKSDEDSKRAAK